MTVQQIKELELKQTPTLNNWDELETELSTLIADENSGLSDLSTFSKNLTTQDKNKNHL
ncbi:MAG: hypothetical protein LBG52_01905 [Candidatus Peribacteria bacterium]|jgi:hypothetical protein|nr:hypothetical protein [Candidatus Peribacteria bacterium]